MVERGDEENAVNTTKFISWSRRSWESSEEDRRGYSSWEERGSEEVDILLMNRLDVLASRVQKEGERGFWEYFSHQIILIPFKESPGSSGLVQTII